jgi:hypothetical protein
MTDRETRIARTITDFLDRGVADIRPGTLYRLQQARADALAGVRRAHARELELAAAGGGPAGRFGIPGGPLRWLGAVLLVAAIGFGLQQWHAVQQVREFEELDLNLLSSDLPIDAYLDRGFQNWVRTSFDR